jgi:DNA helicase-2/ATP-dependent DNA helicase PcrA
VSELVRDLRAEGHTVGVFSHHVDSTTVLSDELLKLGVDHEIIGVPETVTAALDAQHAMIAFAAGAASWDPARTRLAVFVTSTQRGSNAPDLARMIHGDLPLRRGLAARLDDLRGELARSPSMTAAASTAARAYASLGITRGGQQWQRAARLLRPLVTRAARRASTTSGQLDLLDRAVTSQRAGLLTYAVDASPAPAQLMGLYQTKGREADATAVVLRSSDFYGKERAPFPVGSRLLYVVLTRARHKTIVLSLGHEPPALVAPLPS